MSNTHSVILKTTQNQRVAKHQDFESEKEAQDWLSEIQGKYPEAFVIPIPDRSTWGGSHHWKVNKFYTLDSINATNPGTGYTSATVDIVGDGQDATAEATTAFESGDIEQDPNRDLVSEIEEAATRIIESIVPPPREREKMQVAVLLHLEKGKQNLTVGETNELDQLKSVGQWSRNVRETAKSFIENDLPNLTKDQILTFNPETDITWDTPPS